MQSRFVLTFNNLDLVNDTGIDKDATHANVSESDRTTVLPQLSETAKDALTMDDASFFLVPSFLQARGHARNYRMLTVWTVDCRIPHIWYSVDRSDKNHSSLTGALDAHAVSHA
jgi:hypothetical protein